VLIIYNISKPAFNYVIIVGTETTVLSKSDQINDEEMLSDSTKSAFSHNESSHFNPFKNLPTSNMNEIMMAYTYNNFGLDDLKERPMKTILFWNEAYGSKDYGNIKIIVIEMIMFILNIAIGIGFGQQGFQKLNCPITDCYTTDNRFMLNEMAEFDAIVFHLRTFNIEDLPSTRGKNQRWIFWSLESPQYNMQDIYPLDGLFNWTMTYRRDSDVVQPYGWIQPIGSIDLRPEVGKINQEMILAIKRKSRNKKTKLVAWFVSNCQSKSQREQYATTLAKYVQVDVYGECGSMTCERDNVANCYSMLEQDYKFYLSFENSFCDDYVTEKFFSILQLEVVPIVFGGSDYSAISPPFSYINAQDFETAAQLAEYLKMLDSNDGIDMI
jgi:hypothetical protein